MPNKSHGTKTKVQAQAGTGARSITFGGVSFHEQVNILRKRSNGAPEGPMAYALPQLKQHEIIGFPLEVEIELAEGIAYIAAVKKGVESVSASALGLPKAFCDGILIYVASNDGVRAGVQAGLQSIVSVMQVVALREISRQECKDQILTLILNMNSYRINARFTSRKGNRNLVIQGLRRLIGSIVTRTNDLSHLISRLKVLCQSLQNYLNTSNSSRDAQCLETLVLACHHFWTAGGDESTRDMLLRAGVDIDEMNGNPYLLLIAKIAAYEHVSRILTIRASDKRFNQLFRNITIRYVPAPGTIQTSVPTNLTGGSDQCRVHAEVQLVIELDVVKMTKWRKPRAIGSSKAACFLCDLFMKKHGLYFVPRSHGLLPMSWTIPNSDLFTKVQEQAYQRIVGAMSEEIVKKINSPHQRRQIPAMSWQALSQLGKLHYSRQSSVFSTPKLSTHSFGVASVLEHVMTAQPASLPTAKTSGSGCDLKSRDEIDENSHSQHTNQQSDVTATKVTLPETPSGAEIRRSDQYLDQARRDSSPLSHEPLAQVQQMQQDTEPVEDFHDLNNQQRKTAADTIRDHESRICNVSSAYSAVENRQAQGSNALYVHDTYHKFDFHEFELFFEFEQASTTTICVMPDTMPETFSSNIVNAAELDYGHEVTLNFEVNEAENKTLFLKMRTKTDTEKWVKLTWQEDNTNH